MLLLPPHGLFHDPFRFAAIGSKQAEKWSENVTPFKDLQQPLT
jgi:hypothetical protein